LDGFKKVATSSTMITQHAPVLEPGDRVLDACATAAMVPPLSISKDPSSTKSRCDELANAAVSTIGQHATVGSA
jgi:hypothetical protein